MSSASLAVRHRTRRSNREKRTPRVAHTQLTRSAAIAFYESGLSCREVTKRLMEGAQTYVSPQTVARWAREEGKNRPVGEPRHAEIPQEARRLYESGMILEQVAERFHVSKTLVAKRLREMGTEIRPSGSLFGSVLTADRLREMYHKRGMRAQDIQRPWDATQERSTTGYMRGACH